MPPCLFYYTMLLVENPSANSSLESNDINGHLPFGTQIILLEAKGQRGL